MEWESIKTYVYFFVIVFVTFLLAFIVNKLLLRIIKASTEEMKNDPTSYVFLRRIVLGLIYTIGLALAIYTVPSLRTIANSILASAGILAVALGFASQHALSNIISGVFIVFFKPFKINDRLVVQTHMGVVEDISLRHTVIRNFENKRVIIPNALISDEIVVNSDFVNDQICRWIDIGISYDSDIDLAKLIMMQEVLDHPLHVDPRTPEQLDLGIPEVIVRVLGLGESSVNLRAWAWAKDQSDGFVLSCDLYESIKKRFDREGIVIPFPHRTVYIRKEGTAELDGVNL